MIYTNLNPEKALIWRILHRANLPWVLDHGVHCGNSSERSPNWVSIGNAELIDKRAGYRVPVAPGGLLNDYVPFYFTPFSVMLRNIHTGWNSVRQVPNDDIVMLVSSLRRVKELGLPFLFTDSHAYSGLARYFDDLAHLGRIAGRCCRAVTSNETRMIQARWSATRPKRWYTGTCRCLRYGASCVSPMPSGLVWSAK